MLRLSKFGLFSAPVLCYQYGMKENNQQFPKSHNLRIVGAKNGKKQTTNLRKPRKVNYVIRN